MARWCHLQASESYFNSSALGANSSLSHLRGAQGQTGGFFTALIQQKPRHTPSHKRIQNSQKASHIYVNSHLQIPLQLGFRTVPNWGGGLSTGLLRSLESCHLSKRVQLQGGREACLVSPQQRNYLYFLPPLNLAVFRKRATQSGLQEKKTHKKPFSFPQGTKTLTFPVINAFQVKER